MINIKKAKINLKETKSLLALRGFDSNLLDHYLKLNDNFKIKVQEKENLEQQSNLITKKIKIESCTEAKNNLIKSSSENKNKLHAIKLECAELEAEINKLKYTIPNIPDEKIYHNWPGNEYEVTHVSDHKLLAASKVIDHYSFLQKFDLVDGPVTTKMVGTKYVTYKNQGALLHRALVNFLLFIHTTSHCYDECIPPVVISKKSLQNTGHLPKFSSEIYSLSDKQALIPTSEVSLVNLFANQKIKENKFPVKVCAYTQCFRKEAGAAGRKNHGLIRLHQFSKVELVQITKPSQSSFQLNEMLNEVQFILKLLNIPYRVVLLAPWDISFASSFTYDIEVWMPSMQEYVEFSSCSNCSDFQAQNSNIKFIDPKTDKALHCHTINGTGGALDRLIATFVENNQVNKTDVFIPTPLLQFFNHPTLFAAN